MHADILLRLRIDPGHRTLGQLLQDREAAAAEIERLRTLVDMSGKQSMRTMHQPKNLSPASVERAAPFRPGALIRIKEVCELLGLSRSSIYKLVSESSFLKPVRLGAPRSAMARRGSGVLERFPY